MTPTRPTRRAATVLVAALLGALTAWLLTSTGSRSLDDVARSAGLPESAAPTAGPTAGPTTGPPAPRSAVRLHSRNATLPAPRPDGPVPTRLSIPRLGIEMPVSPQGVDGEGAMALPESAFAVGWYRFGSRPSDPTGATVIAGHVDTVEEGAGPLAALGVLRPGDLLAVRTGGRTVSYSVTSVDRIARSVLDLPRVFARDGTPRLHLITCGGEYDRDRGGYQDNVVVSARRVPGAA